MLWVFVLEYNIVVHAWHYILFASNRRFSSSTISVVMLFPDCSIVRVVNAGGPCFVCFVWQYILLLLLCSLCWHLVLAQLWLRRGFCEIIKKVLKLAPFGLLFGGPPCGSWVYINRYTSKRSAQKIFGDCRRGYVRDANTSLSSAIKTDLFVIWSVETILGHYTTSDLIILRSQMVSKSSVLITMD